MPQIKVKNVSSMTLLNRQPGAEFLLNVDDEGVPFGNRDHKGRNSDVFWQQRFNEDRQFNGDKPALQILTPLPGSTASTTQAEPAVVTATPPVAAPPVKNKASASSATPDKE